MSALKCDECGVGRYRLINSPFLMKLGRQMLVMPDAPAYFCDVCGYRAFDEDFLASMHYLIRQAVDDSQRRKRKRQPVQQPDARPISPARQRR